MKLKILFMTVCLLTLSGQALAGGRNITIDELKDMVGTYKGEVLNFPESNTPCEVKISIEKGMRTIKSYFDEGIEVLKNGNMVENQKSYEIKRKINYLLNELDVYDGYYSSLYELTWSYLRAMTIETSITLPAGDTKEHSLLLRQYRPLQPDLMKVSFKCSNMRKVI
jgi:hypothetical protein